MNRRKFLEKFIALSSISLVLTSCSQTSNYNDVVLEDNPASKKKKFKDIISDEPMAVYGPPPIVSEPIKRLKPIK